MPSDRSESWRSLAEQATKETDPGKLARIITELNRLLEGEQDAHRQKLLSDPNEI